MQPASGFQRAGRGAGIAAGTPGDRARGTPFVARRQPHPLHAPRHCLTAPAGSISRSMKILVISLAGIGDTLIATPFIHELRANFPEARIDTFVLWAGSKDLLEGNPHLTTIYQRNLIEEGALKS